MEADDLMAAQKKISGKKPNVGEKFDIGNKGSTGTILDESGNEFTRNLDQIKKHNPKELDEIYENLDNLDKEALEKKILSGNPKTASRDDWFEHQTKTSDYISNKYPGDKVVQQVTMDIYDLKGNKITTIPDNLRLDGSGKFHIGDAKHQINANIANSGTVPVSSFTDNQKEAWKLIQNGNFDRIEMRGEGVTKFGLKNNILKPNQMGNQITTYTNDVNGNIVEIIAKL
ncbi:MAG TPA: hypothetical protein VNB90_01820 [Cytophagaceae bacterium]|nr:hypothetical protein [Cytophagaceae bacterium]